MILSFTDSDENFNKTLRIWFSEEVMHVMPLSLCFEFRQLAQFRVKKRYELLRHAHYQFVNCKLGFPDEEVVQRVLQIFLLFSVCRV